MTNKTLVTGATGFVGGRLLQRLSREDGRAVVAAVRSVNAALPAGVATVLVDGLGPATDWSPALEGVVAVVHCAARAHVMKELAVDPLTVYRQVNVEGTAHLARQAASAGVRRFVFLSSIKVNGEFTEVGQSFTANDAPAPEDPYGISKHEAEQLLRQIAAETGMEVVIVRPPLVYGPGVKANFQSMMRWLARGVPLPLAAVTKNRRSLVALDNLVDLIMTCIDHPAAANQTFLVADGEDVSTAELLLRMARAMNSKARLLPVPVWLLELAASLLGKRDVARRLCGSLQVDISHTRQRLGWAPPIGLDEGLRRAVQGLNR
ncbi:MAG: SDR family oxidoreductase [Dethiobacter sp.]|nr:SDR family oxidoreductase [Dethiobacter sp.]